MLFLFFLQEKNGFDYLNFQLHEEGDINDLNKRKLFHDFLVLKPTIYSHPGAAELGCDLTRGKTINKSVYFNLAHASIYAWRLIRQQEDIYVG